MRQGFILMVLFALITSNVSIAENPPFTISGQIRHRAEVDGKSFIPNTDENWFSLLRSRLNVGIKPKEDVSIFVQVQDARLYGGETSSLSRGTMDGKSPALDFHQAYFAISKLFGSPVDIKVGRQELKYGNERLIGVRNWDNIGRSFDAAVASYKAKMFTLDLFTCKLVKSQSIVFSENFRGAFGNIRFAEPLFVDVYLLSDDNTAELTNGADTGKRKLQRYTLGADLHGKLASLDYELEYYRQTGKIATSEQSVRSDIDAYLISGNVGLTLNQSNNAKASILYAKISGDNNPGDHKVATFEASFGAYHRLYGLMDYFPNRVLPSYGLNDYAFFFAMNVSKSVSLAPELHHFDVDKAYTGATNGKKSLGEELDLVVNIKYNANVAFQTGAAAFVPDDVMRSVKGDNTAYWFFLMTTVNF